MYLIPTGLTYTPWVYYLYAYFNLKAKCSWVFLSYDVTLGCYPQAPSSTQMTDLSFSPVPRHDRTGLWSLSSLDALTLKLTYQTHTHTQYSQPAHSKSPSSAGKRFWDELQRGDMRAWALWCFGMREDCYYWRGACTGRIWPWTYCTHNTGTCATVLQDVLEKSPWVLEVDDLQSTDTKSSLKSFVRMCTRVLFCPSAARVYVTVLQTLPSCSPLCWRWRGWGPGWPDTAAPCQSSTATGLTGPREHTVTATHTCGENTKAALLYHVHYLHYVVS